jgi:hypothetical protein
VGLGPQEPLGLIGNGGMWGASMVPKDFRPVHPLYSGPI